MPRRGASVVLAVVFVTPLPLPVHPPQIVAEAGILPTGFLAFLDRASEFVDRTVFSFGVPALRARVTLAQAAERIAELQALKRRGELTPAVVRGLLQDHERLLLLADRLVARQLVAQRASPELVFLLTRTHLAAADVVGELLEEQEVEGEIADVDRGEEDLRDVLKDAREELVEFEDDLLPAGGAGVPADILQLLAAQKIAKADRDLRQALQRNEERLALGRVLLADLELRRAAESALVSARRFFAEGNSAAALSMAREARGIAGRLRSRTMAMEPETLLSPEGARSADAVIADLAGVLGPEERAAAVQRIRQVMEQLRR